MALNRRQILHDELTSDPLGRGYSGMVDQGVSDDLNSAYRTRTRNRIETWEIIEATVPAEYAALSDGEKQRYQTFIAAGVLDPSGVNTRAAFGAMFGPGTVTRTNLLAMASEAVSRAEELGVPNVTANQVASARSFAP